MKELSTALQSSTSEKKQLEDERQEHIKQRAKMELDLKDLEVSVNEDKASKVFMHYTTVNNNCYHDNIVRVVVRRNWRN